MSNSKIFKEMLLMFNQKLSDRNNKQKFILYSGHD